MSLMIIYSFLTFIFVVISQTLLLKLNYQMNKVDMMFGRSKNYDHGIWFDNILQKTQ